MSLSRYIKYQALRGQRRIVSGARYCTADVWNDASDGWRPRLVKILNLSVRSFMDKKLQQKAQALTYGTMLAAVPALAMLFAVGRGFGFQNLMQGELLKFFPSQRHVLEQASQFVDNYLEHASQGIFVGIGLIVMLWTLISLLGRVEEDFNHIWGVRNNRSYYRKLTDYTAMFIFIPVLMVCSAGLSIFMSNTVQTVLQITSMPMWLMRVLDYMPLVLMCFTFAAALWMIPNTRVKLKYALVSGTVSGLGFYLLQWLFVTGQVYVTSYNAIYGSFAFVLLLLVWLQLSWLIALIGCVLCFSLQNVYNFNYNKVIDEISHNYLNDLSLVTLGIIVRRFERKQDPITREQLARQYHIPVILVNQIVNRLADASLVRLVHVSPHEREPGLQPAFDIAQMTVNTAVQALESTGGTDFVAEVDQPFAPYVSAVRALRKRQLSTADVPITQLHLPGEEA